MCRVSRTLRELLPSQRKGRVESRSCLLPTDRLPAPPVRVRSPYGTRGRTRSSNPSWVARHTSRRGATCGLRCFHSPQYLGATPDAKWVPLADALRTWLLAPAPEVLETPECFRSSQRAGSASDGLLVTVVPRVRLPTGGLPWTSNHLPPR